MKSHVVASSIFGVAAMFVGAGPAIAQQGSGPSGAASATSNELAEVVVTAQKRDENLQDAAVSVAVLSGRDLADSGLSTGSNFIPSALEDVVGVQVQNSAITIRGVSSSDVLIGFNPATAAYVDGVFSPLGGGVSTPAGRHGPGFGVSGGNLDTQRIEVLRGPQGTLFGRSATGGVINIVTNDPSTQAFGAEGVLEVGDYGLSHFGAALNVPVTSNFALRAAYDSVDREGYLSNGQADDHQQQVRLKALYRTDRWSAMAAVYYERFGEGYGAFGQVAPFTDTPPEPRRYQTVTPSQGYNAPSEQWQVYGRLVVDLGFATATYIPSYSWQENPTNVVAVSAFAQTTTSPAINSTFHEFRLASQPESRLTWVIGANYYDSLNRTTITYTTTPPAPPLEVLRANLDNEAKSWGVFGEATYPITTALRATLGVRYSEEEQDVNQFGHVFGAPNSVLASLTFNATNYKARLEYDLGPDNLLYASVSTGTRPGGITSVGNAAFGSETVTAFEVGSKNRFLDNRLQLNGSVFYYDYPSLQGTDTLFVAGPGGAYAPFATLIFDDPARYLGAELETAFQVTANDYIQFSIAYLDAEYTSLNSSVANPLAPGQVITSDEAFDGVTRLASAPEWQISGVYNHRFLLPGGASLTPEIRADYRSATYVVQATSDYARQPAYTLINASLRFTSADGRYSLTAYGRNLTDEYYKVAGNLNPSVPLSSQGLYVGIPRTYGIILSARF